MLDWRRSSDQRVSARDPFDAAGMELSRSALSHVLPRHRHSGPNGVNTALSAVEKVPDMSSNLIIAFVLATVPATSAAAQDLRTVETSNEAVIRAHHDAINRGEIARAAADYAETFLNNGNPIDRARVQSIIADNAQTFPDWKMKIDRLVAQGDQVVALITVSGTHMGVSQRPVNGGLYLGVPATGKRFSVLHTHWFVLEDGKITEHRATRDDLGMSRQLGLLPPAPARPPK